MPTEGSRAARPKISVLLGIFLLVSLISSLCSTSGQATGTTTHTVCPSGCDFTTIQGAITAASNGDTVQILVTAPFTEHDIVVSKDLTFEGISAMETIVQAAPSPGSAPGRVFTVLSGVDVTIQDLTVRHGNTGNPGGGIHNNGGTVTLENVNLTENQADDGGGIYNDGGTVNLRGGIISDNDADWGAGVFNSGTLTIFGSQFFTNSGSLGGAIHNSGTMWASDVLISSNQASNGGGIYNLGTAWIARGQILSNQASNASMQDGGGGLYNLGDLTLISSDFSNNLVSVDLFPTRSGGGGIFQRQGSLTVSGGRFLGNSVGDGDGGGLFVDGGDVTLSRSLLELNDASRGGGIHLHGGALVISDTTLANNQAVSGGAINSYGGSLDLSSSTIHANAAISGGGLYLSTGATNNDVENATFSDNSVTEDGGGIFVSGGVAHLNLANVTVAENQADDDADGNGHGGGIYVDTDGTLNVTNSVIAGNQDLSPGSFARAPDCRGTVVSDGYNLIGSLGTAINGTHCVVTGSTMGNMVGVSAGLGPLQDNGGPTWTHELLAASPAIDAGNPAGCQDYDGNPLTTDQRGGLRVDRCDIGAFEQGALANHTYLPLLSKP